MRILVAIWALTAGVASVAFAQSEGAAPLMLELPAGPHALALGGIVLPDLEHPEAVFYNPALVAQAEGVAVGVQRYRSAATLATFAAATDLRGGTLGLGLQALTYGAAQQQSPDLADALLTGGPVGASDLAVTLAYARELWGLQLGAGVKLLEQRLGDRRDATFASDFGVAKAASDVTFGLAFQHLGTALSTTETDTPLPARATLSAALDRTPLGPLDVAAAAAVARWQDGAVVPSGGLELSYWPINGRTLIGRIGLRRVPRGTASPITFGLAFTADAFTIEYAFEGFEGRGSGHRLGLRWR